MLRLFSATLRLLQKSSFPNLSKSFLYSNLPSSKSHFQFARCFSTSNSPHMTPQELASFRVLSLLQDGEMFLKTLNYSECRKRYEEALRTSVQEIGATSNESGLSLNCLGQLTHLQGDILRALDLYTQALDILSTDTEKNRILCASIQNNMSVIYQSLKDYERVVEYLEGATELLKDSDNIESQQKADIFGRIGALRMSEENFQSAKEFFLKAVTLLEKAQREGDTTLGKIYLELGDIYEKEKDIETATQFREKGVGELKVHQSCSGLLTPIYESLVNYYRESQDNNKVLEYNKELLAILQHSLKPKAIIQSIRVSKDIGDVYLQQNNYNEAIEAFRNLELKFEPADVIVSLYHNMGKAFLNSEQKAAIRYLNEGLEVFENFGRENTKEIGDMNRALGDAYVKTAKNSKARTHYKKALKIYQEFPEESKEEIEKVEKKLKELESNSE